MKKGVHLGWKVSVLPQKAGHFGLKSQCFITKKGSFWAEKSLFCCKKGGHFQTGEQGCVPLFPVNEGAGKLLWLMNLHQLKMSVKCIMLYCTCKWTVYFYFKYVTMPKSLSGRLQVQVTVKSHEKYIFTLYVFCSWIYLIIYHNIILYFITKNNMFLCTYI